MTQSKKAMDTQIEEYTTKKLVRLETNVIAFAKELADGYSFRHSSSTSNGYIGSAKFNSERALVCTVFWFLSSDDKPNHFQTRFESMGYVSPMTLTRIYNFVQCLQEAGLHPG